MWTWANARNWKPAMNKGWAIRLERWEVRLRDSEVMIRQSRWTEQQKIDKRRGTTVLIHSELLSTRGLLLLTELLAVLLVSASLHISHRSRSRFPGLYFSALLLAGLLAALLVGTSLHYFSQCFVSVLLCILLTGLLATLLVSASLHYFSLVC